MHNDAVRLLEDLLRAVKHDIEALQEQTANCMGDVRIVNALLDVQMAYTNTVGVIEASLRAVQ